MKKFVLFIVSIFITAFTFVQAVDVVPYFYFQSNSGDRLKLYCTNGLKMWVDAGSQKYNAFESYIKFDTGDIQITSLTVNSDFSNGQKSELFRNFYHVGGAMPGGYKTGSVWLVNFNYKTLKNITGTVFSIKDSNGTNNYGLSTTADGLSLNGYDVGSKDILTGVEDILLDFYAYPCDVDTKSPTIGNLNKSGTTYSVDGQTKIPSDQTLSFETYDWDSLHKVNYWFSGNDTGNLDNYVSAPSNVDNQEGVNSGTISVKVSCANCSNLYSNVDARLNISDWNGTSGKNALTWDSERRGYNVSFDAPFPYEVEKEIVIKVSVSDNANELGTTHTGTSTIKFNSPVPPTIDMLEPTNTLFASPSRNNPLKFYFSDDWAGVDSGTISLEIKEITGENDEIIMTGYVYSGSELSMSLSGGSEGIGNEAKYEVEFYPKRDFPENKIITVVAYAKDLAGNPKTERFTLSTRQSCAFYGCRESTNIFGPLGNTTGLWFKFTGSVLIISGYSKQGETTYPYLSGNELICRSSDWDGLMITGNVDLYNENNESLGKSMTYTNNVLYATGSEKLDIYLDENGKVVAKKKN